MTYSPDARTRLADRLRDLFPAAHTFAFDTARTTVIPGAPDRLEGRELLSLTVEFDDDAFDDLPNGLATPGAPLAETLSTLGWLPDSSDGDPVDDDVPTITFNRPRDDSPIRLLELWTLIEAAFVLTPGHDLETSLS